MAFHAPLFHELVLGLEPTKRHVVLDLGAASTGMLALLGRSRCRVDIADFAYSGDIDVLNASEKGPALAHVADTLLPTPQPGDARPPTSQNVTAALCTAPRGGEKCAPLG